MGRQPSAACQAKKKAIREQRYELRRRIDITQYERDIRRLSCDNIDDCEFAKKFAENAKKEVEKLEMQQSMRPQPLIDEGAATDCRTRNQSSIFGFFHKSSVLLEAISPAVKGTSHLLIQMGVPGCGKTTYIKEFLSDAFSSRHSRLHKANPAVLLCSTTNLQCRELFRAIRGLHQENGSIPGPAWCASQQWLEKAETMFPDPLLQLAVSNPAWSNEGSITICTHDFAARNFASNRFSIVIIDEIGALELYKGCCLLGLAWGLGLLIGDPLQGSRPCTTLADKHMPEAINFKSHSHRCPDQVMKLVTPAYRVQLADEQLELTGITNRNYWCLQTYFCRETLRCLRTAYGDGLLIMGFTHEAIRDLPRACTVDSAIGLQAPVVVLIIEQKEFGLSHQYDVRRLVPAVTRCTHALIVMWQNGSWRTLTDAARGQQVRVDMCSR